MKANPDKFQEIAIGKNTQSKNISFNLNGNIIKTEDEVKLLGVTIDYELKFTSHITNICRKASRQLNVLGNDHLTWKGGGGGGGVWVFF